MATIEDINRLIGDIPRKVREQVPTIIATEAVGYYKERFRKKDWDGQPWKPAKNPPPRGSLMIRSSQRSHQFINSEGTRRITIGFNVIDNYDDTVDAGIAKVKEYISSLARDEQSKILVETVLKLLSKDSKGTLKASRVLQLQQMAEKSENADFIEGVRIIRDAYRPIESKSYVRAEYKSDSGAWVSVPLGMTEAD